MQKFYRNYLLKIEAFSTIKTTFLVSVVSLCKLNLHQKKFSIIKYNIFFNNIWISIIHQLTQSFLLNK